MSEKTASALLLKHGGLRRSIAAAEDYRGRPDGRRLIAKSRRCPLPQRVEGPCPALEWRN